MEFDKSNPLPPEQLEKLPKWARDHIKTIERERDEAVRKAEGLFDAQEPGPVTFEPTGGLGVVPRFLNAETSASGHDFSSVKFWMHGQRWAPHATDDYLQVSRGISTGGRFTREQMADSLDKHITVRSGSGRLIVHPLSSQEVTIEDRAWRWEV